MSKIEGRAKKHDGTAIDYVSIFNWLNGKCLEQIVPDATGNWEWEYYFDYKIGITYVADGCEPITHGAYDIVGVENLITNGNFDNNLDGWSQASGYWLWADGRAYHPPGSAYKPLNQSISNLGVVKVTAVVSVLNGLVNAYAYSVASGTTSELVDLGVGTHNVEFIFSTDPTSFLEFTRVSGSIITEFYVDNVIVTQV